ncbi:MAG: carboxypeptidase-like regulatory domain-containing protein [Bacteroidales bacterium]
MKNLLYLLSLLFCIHTSAQQRVTISGTVKEKGSGEALIGASVSVKGSPTLGTTANEYGHYSLTLNPGNYILLFQSIGFTTQERAIVLNQPLSLAVELEENLLELEEVVVSSGSAQSRLRRAEMGVERLSSREMARIPVLLGERDVLKSLQYIPGIKQAGEGNTGFYVRGGGADQNLILLDEAPVYNASHLLGFFSTFNSDAIRDITIYKGGMPAQYGGRLSSVLDMKMNEGNNQTFHSAGSLGLISTKLSLEGPIQQDKSSFFLSGRRTYADLFLKLSNKENLRNNKLYFYDINAKANYILSTRDKLFVSLYAGRDKLGFQNIFGVGWGNTTATVRWNRQASPRMFINTSLIYSNFNYNVDVNFGGSGIDILSEIRDWNIKQEFQYTANPKNLFRFGFNAIHHAIQPGKASSSVPDRIIPKAFQKRAALENALFASHSLEFSEKLNITYGLRLSFFSVLGGGDLYRFDDSGAITDTLSYPSWRLVKTYIHAEPRLSFSYRLSESSSIKGSYARNTQNMHLLSNATMASPFDRWTPSSNLIKPEISDQYSIGYYRTFFDDNYDFSVESYYKNLQNQIDYKDGAEPIRTEVIESDLVFGKGRAYGIELFLKKRYGKLNGWIGYTLSRSEKRIEKINQNRWYPAKQDRTHDISIVAFYTLSPKWSLSANWVYATGNAVTYPSGKYIVDDQVVNYYSERNGYRVEPYHRLDAGATHTLKKRGKYSAELSFGIYNLYGRANPFMIIFREDPKDVTRTQAVKYSLFKMVPSISYNFKF